MALDLPANMSMGGIDALRSIWTTDTPPVPFNGAQCVRCYYGGPAGYRPQVLNVYAVPLNDLKHSIYYTGLL
jgi:hypothetical protein